LNNRGKTVDKKTVFSWVAAIIIISVLLGLIAVKPEQLNQQTQKTMQNIIINTDGTLTPSDAPIQHYDNVYRLTDNIYGTIKILKNNIVLNGGGHTLSGPYNGSQANVWVVGNGPNQSPELIAEYIIGIDFSGKNVDGIIIQNINVRNFSIGMYVWTTNNTVTSSKIYDNIVGILLSGENNTIIHNYIEDNKQGLFMGFNNEGNTTIPPDIVINHNDFENNDVQLNGCSCKTLNSSETPHRWDDGEGGNYWSDYNGTDADRNGIGDTPYVVDALNVDRYPLMTSPYHIVEEVLTPRFDPVIIIFSMVFLVLITYLILVLMKKMKR
jgi:parallel beta-helix repeat protein